MVRLALVAAALAGCYAPAAPAGAPCGPGGTCPTGQRCIADVCQSVGDGIDACVDRCEAGNVLSCGGQVTLCDHGCAAAPTPHCAALAPTYNLSADLLVDATADFAIDKAVFDTDTGEIRVQSDVVRAPGEGVVAGIGFAVVDEMGVFTAHSFALGAGQDWDAGGSHPLVLFAATTIAIAGELDVGATFPNAGGPGGANGGTSTNEPPCRGRAGLWIRNGFGAGGGGGGGATVGGDGAPSSDPNSFGAGGDACEVPSTIPLRGGNGGGAGGVDPQTGARAGSGGGGGGAVALVAFGSITIDGVVGAPGGGGNTSIGDDGGGGGGSGGAIFVEAPTVNVSGALTANGGGGGGPTSNDGSRGYMTSDSPASGGSANGASGGRGGAGTTAPTDGTNYNDGNLTVSRGGGGGGAAGVIRIRRRAGEVSGLTSPPAIVEDAVVQ